MNLSKLRLPLTAILILMTLIFTACTSKEASTVKQQPTSSATTKRIVKDMMGRDVKLPLEIKKAVTVGSVPVINSFIFAVGEGDTIVNGLPDFARKPRWKYQTVFAPSMANLPIMQGASGREPLTEEILKAAPDVVFTMDKDTDDVLKNKGITVFYLSCQEPEDVKTIVSLMSEIYNKKDSAKQYSQYFDKVIDKMQTAVAGVPVESRPKVLYMNVDNLSQPHLIAEWWITAAGGVSVTNDGRIAESLGLSMEQILVWNPDVLIVANAQQLDDVMKDKRFKEITAVTKKQVYVAPVGAHIWGNRTVEQPLTVLWAHHTFYPDLMSEEELRQEVKQFYDKFFNFQLNDEQVGEILSGKL